MGRTACTEPQCLYKGALYSETEFEIFNSEASWQNKKILLKENFFYKLN